MPGQPMQPLQTIGNTYTANMSDGAPVALWTAQFAWAGHLQQNTPRLGPQVPGWPFQENTNNEGEQSRFLYSIENWGDPRGETFGLTKRGSPKGGNLWDSGPSRHSWWLLLPSAWNAPSLGQSPRSHMSCSVASFCISFVSTLAFHHIVILSFALEKVFVAC